MLFSFFSHQPFSVLRVRVNLKISIFIKTPWSFHFWAGSCLPLPCLQRQTLCKLSLWILLSLLGRRKIYQKVAADLILPGNERNSLFLLRAQFGSFFCKGQLLYCFNICSCFLVLNRLYSKVSLKGKWSRKHWNYYKYHLVIAGVKYSSSNFHRHINRANDGGKQMPGFTDLRRAPRFIYSCHIRKESNGNDTQKKLWNSWQND